MRLAKSRLYFLTWRNDRNYGEQREKYTDMRERKRATNVTVKNRRQRNCENSEKEEKVDRDILSETTRNRGRN